MNTCGEAPGDIPQPPIPNAESESLLRAVDELADRLQRGESVDFQAELAARPEHANRLQEVFSALELLCVLRVSNSALEEDSAAPVVSDFVSRSLGDFRILREIGRGGMGVVYEAEQVSLGRRVALKVFPFAGMYDPRRLQRFQNEARAAAGLHHPHIVPVFAVGCERGVHYYAMQYIDGRSLAEMMSAQRTPEAVKSATSASTVPDHAAARTVAETRGLDWQQTATWGAEVAEALDYAHALGIVHRDIKPANLLVDARQKLWVTDFGLAQIAAAEGPTMTGDILGTLRYMSPEQAEGERGLVDQRSDIYSLGATLYELLSGEPVFGSADRPELLRKILHDDPVPLRKLRAEIPSELATIVQKCLEREPQGRYATASQLADDLRRYLNDQPIRAKPPSQWDRIRKWSRRNSAAVRMGLVFGGLLLFGLVVAGFQIERARQETRLQQQARESEERIHQSAQQTLAVNRYVTLINRADRSFHAGDYEAARAILIDCVPEAGEDDFRGFEWNYLWHALREREPPVAKHQGMAYGVRLSPDGRLIATAGQDGARIWDSQTMTPVAHLTDHGADVNSVTFSPDGSRLATAGDDRAIRIWSTRNWSLERVLPHESVMLAA